MDKQQLLEWKAGLLEEIRKLEVQIAPLQTELKIAKERLVAIERLLVLEIKPLEAVSDILKDETKNLNGKKASDVAYEVLRDFGVPMHYQQLYQTIFDRGLQIGGRDPATNLIAHISKDSRFQRISRGTYALREWKLVKASKARKVRGKSK